MYRDHTHQDYATLHYELRLVQARRRQGLGIFLLLVGSVWMYLRLTGQVGDMPMPICWVDAPAAILAHFNLGCQMAFVPEDAYGMLASLTIHRTP